MMHTNVLILAALMVLAACSTTAQRRATEGTAVQREAAKEIARICALPEPERQAEIDRVKKEAAMAIVCPK